jgi:uncharacterized Zn finger protein (UPF0148 family)
MTATTRCPACGCFVQSGDAFCWSCGSPLRTATQPPARQARPQPRPTELDPEAALALRRAHLAQQRGQLDEAERLLHSILERAPNAVPALSMLVAILRAKGDLVGSVAAAQRVSEVAAEGAPPPGAVARAREDRAKIEEQVVREITGPLTLLDTPFSIFTSADRDWPRSRRVYIALAVIGACALFFALVAVLKGQMSGYLWFGASFLMAGWCYHDAENRRLPAILWAPFVLFLGPFGLAVYLLSTT